MKKLLIFLLVWVSFWPILVHAQDTTTPNFGLTKPALESPDWGPKINTDLDLIDAAIPTLGLSCTTGQVPTWSAGKFSICGSGAGHTIYDEANPLAARSKLRFLGAGVSAVDNAGNDSTDVTITGTSLSIAGTGLVVQTAPDVYVTRNLTGETGEIEITSNAGGVGGNPVIGVGVDVVRRNQANTYSGGGLQDLTSSLLTLPQSVGYAPTQEGRIGVNTATHRPVIGLNGVSVGIGLVGDLPASLAANGTNGTAENFARGIDASGNAGTGKVALNAAADPGASICEFAGQTYVDTRAFVAGSAGYTYRCQSVGGTPSKIAAEQDGPVTVTDGLNSYTYVGPSTETVRGADGTTIEVFPKAAAAYTNQPSNDTVEILSSNVGDTTQFVKVWGTLNGGNDRDLTSTLMALNGTTPVASSAGSPAVSNFKNIVAWRICTAACAASTTAAGTVTLRKGTGDATISTLAPGSTRNADIYTTIASPGVGAVGTGQVTAALKTKQIIYKAGCQNCTTLVDADDEANIFVNRNAAMTITEIKAWTDTGTSTINIERDDGVPANICTSDLIASTAGVTCTLSGSEKLIAVDHKLNFKMVTAATTGTPHVVTVSITGTLD